MVDVDAIRASLTTHLQHDLNGTLICKWAAVVEVMDEDGNRELLVLTPEDQTQWDTAGILAFANPNE